MALAEACLRAKFHLEPSNRLATIGLHQRHRQDRQRPSDSIGRTVLETVAQKPQAEDMVAVPAFQVFVRILCICGLFTKGNRNRMTKSLEMCESETEQSCTATIRLLGFLRTFAV